MRSDSLINVLQYVMNHRQNRYSLRFHAGTWHLTIIR